MWPLALLATTLLALSSAHPLSSRADPSLAHLFARQHAYPTTDVKGPVPKAEWVAAYNTAKAAGLIPNFPPSVISGSTVTYKGVDPSKVCSWTYSKCTNGDVTEAPNGMAGIAFDDGPQPPSAQLLPFLRSINQTATHFMIGSRIVDNMALFQQTLSQNHDHIAVHTWSHPYMTTLNDSAVVGELGWTMQVIYDNSGLVPAWWRPPYGDVDARVRAIAKHVFGLTTVIWNFDSNDWCLADTAGQGSSCPASTGPQNLQQLESELFSMYSSPKTPGIIVLEHELATRAVSGFVAAWPTITAQGWDARAIPDLFGASWYANAPNGVASPAAASNILPTAGSPFTLDSGSAIPPATASSTSTSAPSASASASSSVASSTRAVEISSTTASAVTTTITSSRPTSSSSRSSSVASTTTSSSGSARDAATSLGALILTALASSSILLL